MTSDNHDETPPPESDLEIVRLIRERDGRGLRLLLQCHGGNVAGALRVWFRGHLKSTDIDEVVSAASFRAWQNIHTYSPARGTLRAWFLLICRNLGRDILRQRGLVNHEALDDALEARLATKSQSQPKPPHRLLQVLLECIEALPPLQKSVIEADLLSDGTANAAELAEALDTTPNSIYVTRSNARKALKEALIARGLRFEPTPTKDHRRATPLPMPKSLANLPPKSARSKSSPTKSHSKPRPKSGP